MVERFRSFARETLLRRVYPHGWFRSRRLDFGPVGQEPALIAMCLWNRPAHFRTMLDNFAAQDHPDGLILGLWNNDRSLTSHYEQEIEKWRRESDVGALRRIYLTHSPINTGGPGRYYMGRMLAHRYQRPYMIFIDDDQVIGPSWASDVLAQAEPKTQKSWWAWNISNDEYWDRERAQPGTRVEYAATCGMVTDATILDHPMLFRDLPRESWFIEDIWLNHIALLENYDLIALDVDMDFVLDETNQNHQLAPVKPAFYRSLVEQRRHVN